jgi:hypothetical protein
MQAAVARSGTRLLADRITFSDREVLGERAPSRYLRGLRFDADHDAGYPDLGIMCMPPRFAFGTATTARNRRSARIRGRMQHESFLRPVMTVLAALSPV